MGSARSQSHPLGQHRGARALFPPGSYRKTVMKHLSEACLKTIPTLTVGTELTPFRFIGVPFPVELEVGEGGLNPMCVVSRSGSGLKQNDLAAAISRALVEKADQLEPFQKTGLCTILLMESVPPTNREAFAEAFLSASQGANLARFNEIYLADGGHTPTWIFPLKLASGTYPDLPEWRHFFEKQYRMLHGPG